MTAPGDSGRVVMVMPVCKRRHFRASQSATTVLLYLWISRRHGLVAVLYGVLILLATQSTKAAAEGPCAEAEQSKSRISLGINSLLRLCYQSVASLTWDSLQHCVRLVALAI